MYNNFWYLEQHRNGFRGLLPSLLGVERRLDAPLRRLLERHAWPPTRIQDVLAAVREACLNAVEHGNGTQPEFVVTVSAELLTEHLLRVCITDQGTGLTPPPRPSLHLGWKVIQAFSQHARLYSDRQTHQTTAELLFQRREIEACRGG